MRRIDSLLSYTFSHFCVDFACFYVAYSYVYANFDLYVCALFFFAYNVLAFGLQAVIGYFCDTHESFPAGIVGCGIVFVSLFLFFTPILAILISGLGNAFFHVGGGIDSLKNAEGKMARSGVFVSSGALGVTLGTIYGMGNYSVVLPICLLVLSAVCMFVFAESKGAREATSQMDFVYKDFNFEKNASFTAGILLACGTIFVRCFAGYLIPLGWYDNSVLLLAVAYGGSAMLGKATGGFIGDRFGGCKSLVSLLILSVPFLMFGGGNMAISLVGIFLFNTSMPITLCVIFSRLHKNAGLSFGISTLALLIGTFPAVFGLTTIISSAVILPIVVALSAVCLYFATAGKSNKKSELDMNLY
ncbi:MAG: hypothetical protein R3Y18_03100 [Bacillota bacterium]